MDPQQQPTQPQNQPKEPSVDYPQPHASINLPPSSLEPLVVTPSEVMTPGVPHKPSIKIPIILMAWPAAAIVLSILLYALINFLITSSSSDTFGNESPIKAIFNIVLFSIGALSVFLGPISFIVGLVLLIVRKSNK